jgi:hypothetical protein
MVWVHLPAHGITTAVRMRSVVQRRLGSGATHCSGIRQRQLQAAKTKYKKTNRNNDNWSACSVVSPLEVLGSPARGVRRRKQTATTTPRAFGAVWYERARRGRTHLYFPGAVARRECRGTSDPTTWPALYWRVRGPLSSAPPLLTSSCCKTTNGTAVIISAHRRFCWSGRVVSVKAQLRLPHLIRLCATASEELSEQCHPAYLVLLATLL